MGTPNGIECPFLFTYALSLNEHVLQHTCGALFVLVPYLTAEIKEICLFVVGVIEHFLRQMSLLHKYSWSYLGFYALLRHFYKYTTQSMTVKFQQKLSRHNFHERTCGHHLQYDHFHTELSRNWRELKGNNFIDHMTNTCSDDSRSCDFIVVWELRCPLRLLPTFEETWCLIEKGEISGHNCNSKLELSWKFLRQWPQISKG